jgi:cell division protein FtsA
MRNYGYTETRKKPIAGIVLTGGGAQLKHIAQLFEFVTGLSTRIGYPSEHLASGSNTELSSPQYATSIGLVMRGLHDKDVDRNMAATEEEIAREENPPNMEEALPEVVEDIQTEAELEAEREAAEEAAGKLKKKDKKGSWWDRWSKTFLTFLENDVE